MNQVKKVAERVNKNSDCQIGRAEEISAIPPMACHKASVHDDTCQKHWVELWEDMDKVHRF